MIKFGVLMIKPPKRKMHLVSTYIIKLVTIMFTNCSVSGLLKYYNILTFSY